MAEDTEDAAWDPYKGVDPETVAKLRATPVRVPRDRWLDRFAEVNRHPVTFAPETCHPTFTTYYGASEDRLYPLHRDPVALRRIPLGDYLTRAPSGFHRGTPKDLE